LKSMKSQFRICGARGAMRALKQPLNSGMIGVAEVALPEKL
jgi:hypothetical protein